MILVKMNYLLLLNIFIYKYIYINILRSSKTFKFVINENEFDKKINPSSLIKLTIYNNSNKIQFKFKY